MQSPDTPRRAGTVVYEWACQGELVIVLDPVVLVRAKSKLDQRQYYIVEEGRCTCAGFQFRSTCRHLSVAKLAIATIHALESPMLDFMEAKKGRRPKRGTQAKADRGGVSAAPRTNPSRAGVR